MLIYTKIVTIFSLFCFQYCLFLGSIYLIELITVMVTYIFRDRVVEALQEGIYRSMEMYGRETQSNQAIDFLQSKVEMIVK